MNIFYSLKPSFGTTNANIDYHLNQQLIKSFCALFSQWDKINHLEWTFLSSKNKGEIEEKTRCLCETLYATAATKFERAILGQMSQSMSQSHRKLVMSFKRASFGVNMSNMKSLSLTMLIKVDKTQTNRTKTICPRSFQPEHKQGAQRATWVQCATFSRIGQGGYLVLPIDLKNTTL